ncbi:hypothetical protein SAMN05444062_110173 [Pseudomonas syringae]|nr:hypothetical protein SAMN05444062_110173 [Pseudomonas syringae]
MQILDISSQNDKLEKNLLLDLFFCQEFGSDGINIILYLS